MIVLIVLAESVPITVTDKALTPRRSENIRQQILSPIYSRMVQNRLKLNKSNYFQKLKIIQDLML